MMCRKCMGMMGALALIVGILFALRDFGVWGFWGIQWWSAAFVIYGVKLLATRSCEECCKLNGIKK